jgi:wyosine [tRNA(Phe)-imidazoG37] synthetase (radical SAM superfamily)
VSAARLRHIYGPVPSRRLGQSFGIDLVPFKTCTYDCIYCHLGRTTHKTLERREYVAVADVLSELEQKLASADTFDYITLAGSGEPTLHDGIGDLILKIKAMTNIPVAVLTNGSLLWMRDVQDALMPADLVLPSLDAGDKLLYRYVNRPHKDISFEQMVDGLAGFADRYKGDIWLEVLLLGGVTGIHDEVEKIASIIRRLKPKRVQMNTVVRPPAEEFATPLSQNQMLKLRGLLPGKVEIISDAETGDWRKLPRAASRKSEIFSLIMRRPCTSTDVARSLGMHTSEALKSLHELVMSGKIRTVAGNRRTFYIGSIKAEE